MSTFIAALPMYDWPEVRAEVDAEWSRLGDALRRRGVDAPAALTRENTPAHGLELAALWRHPHLLFAQTCWGPMGLGLAEHVQVIGQPDYSGFEGGQGALYSSAIVMCRSEAPANGSSSIPLDRLRGRRLAYNSQDSMSGIMALAGDLAAMGEGLGIFSQELESGGHRASIVAVAEGRADVAAIDCRSWSMAQRFEPAAKELAVVGWTARRRGLPYITARATPLAVVTALREALSELGMIAAPATEAQPDRRSSRG
jgi:ABC-type phosphate/phosphonate transport system substrate-binding protein